jgi:HPt (histidine-containing phosphotransfer) domain-containing protein
MNLHLAKPYTCQGLLDIVSQAAQLNDSLRAQALPARPDAVAGGLPPVDDTDLPICDLGIFNRTASLLSLAAVHGHVQTLAARSEEVLRLLRQPAAIPTKAADLAAAAHMLAGSAGLLGFRRLSASARQFESIVLQDLAGIDPAAQGLTNALESTLQDMRSRLAA